MPEMLSDVDGLSAGTHNLNHVGTSTSISTPRPRQDCPVAAWQMS